MNTIQTNVIYIEKLSALAILPARVTSGSAGMDLASPVSISIPPGHTVLIKTDLKVTLPLGTYGKIEERSGLSLYGTVIVKGGVIDQDYTGNIGVILYNYGRADFSVARGDRIAQLIIQNYTWPCLMVEVQHVAGKSTMMESASDVASPKPEPRGDAGFGSTGK